MTIRLLRPFNGYNTGDIVTLDSATEVALVANVAASTDLSGGQWVQNNDVFSSNRPNVYGVACEDFGASPSASASANQLAIQTALNQGGAVSLTVPGTYAIASDTFTFSAVGTQFNIGPAVTFTISGSPIAPLSLYNNANGIAPNNTPGFRTVLFGDSMTSHYQEDLVTSSATYDSKTGMLTFPATLHGLATGWPISLYNGNVNGLATQIRRTVLRMDANNFAVQLPANLAIPASITSNTYARPDYYHSAKGWPKWFNTLSGNRFNIVFNGAQSGDVTSNCLARLQVNCLQYGPQVVLMQLPGINDMANNVQEETIWQNQKTILARITKVAVCVCLTVTPVRSGEVRATLQNMQRVMRLRQRLLAYAQDNPKVIVVDSYSLVVDPTNSTGLASASNGYILGSPDFIHYSPAGAYAVANAAWQQVKNFFPGPSTQAASSGYDSYTGGAVTITAATRASNVVTATAASHGFLAGEKVKLVGGGESWNIIANLISVTTNTFTFASAGTDGAITGSPTVSRNANIFPIPLLLTSSGGTVTGGTATGTAAAGIKITTTGTVTAATASVISNANGFGNSQQLVIQPGAANCTGVIQIELTNTLLPYMKAGRTYYFEAEVVLSGISASNLTELKHRVFMTTDGNTYEAKALTAIDNVAAGFPDGTYDIQTPQFVLQAGTTTAVQWDVTAKFSASSVSSLTYSVGRIKVIEVEMM